MQLERERDYYRFAIGEMARLEILEEVFPQGIIGNFLKIKREKKGIE